MTPLLASRQVRSDLRAADAAREMSLAARSDSKRICLVTDSGTAGIAEDTAATTAEMMSWMSEGASREDLTGLGAAGIGD